MFAILGQYGIPEPIIETIRVLYTKISSTSVTPDGETKPIVIMTGIFQGGTLAPSSWFWIMCYECDPI